MEAEEFITKKIEMINSDYGLSQIRNEVWEYVAEDSMGILNINAMIDRSMELYAEIIKRANV